MSVLSNLWDLGHEQDRALRAAQLKSGGSGYDFVSMVFGRARVKKD